MRKNEVIAEILESIVTKPRRCTRYGRIAALKIIYENYMIVSYRVFSPRNDFVETIMTHYEIHKIMSNTLFK